MLYDIEVRPTPGKTGHFTYYTETVEALTSHDAEARVQRRNPGCTVRCTRSYDAPKAKSSSSSSSSGGGLGGLIFLGLLIAGFSVFSGGGDKDSTQPSVTTKEPEVTQPRVLPPSERQPVQHSQRVQPVQNYDQREANACKIWADANPSLAAKLTSRDRCFGQF